MNANARSKKLKIIIELIFFGWIEGVYLVCNSDKEAAILEASLARIVQAGKWQWIKKLFARRTKIGF